MTVATIRHLNILLKLVELAPDPRSEPLSEALVERLRWAKGAGAPAYWRLVRQTPGTSRSTRELIEEQYDRSR
jgi:hypothetical protein